MPLCRIALALAIMLLLGGCAYPLDFMLITAGIESVDALADEAD